MKIFERFSVECIIVNLKSYRVNLWKRKYTFVSIPVILPHQINAPLIIESISMKAFRQ